MKRTGTLIKVLAIAGTVLLWLPVLAPLAFGVIHYARAGRFLVDYLMPAELFFVVLAGGLSLIVAALMARAYRRLLIAALAGGVAFLAAALAIAEVSGLASGAIEPEGIWWALTVVGVALYIAGIIAAGVGGILLLRRLFGGAAASASAAS